MGWSGLSLSEFIINNPLTCNKVSIEIPDEEEIYNREIFSVFKEKISKWFFIQNNKAKYIYNFNDFWEYEIILEKILPKNPEHPKHKECLESVRDDFDPEYFDPEDVYFEEPEKRRKTFKDFY